MGVFEKLPYLNYHDINLDWLVRQTKKNAADNTYLMKIFKWFQDHGLVGVVTDITENPDDTVKIEYTETETQTTDDFTVYNKNGVDVLVSGLSGRIDDNDTDISNLQGDVTGLDNRLGTAEGYITNLQSNKLDKTTVSTNDILTDAENMGAYQVKFFNLNGSNYTGTLPNNNYKYSSGMAIKRSSSNIIVIVYPILDTDPIIYNAYYSGSWSGWLNITHDTGTILTGSDSSVSVPTATMTTVSTLTITPGKWIIDAYADWAETFSSIYVMTISAVGIFSKGVRNMGDGGGGASLSIIAEASANTVVNLNMYQGSGTSKTARPYLKAIKVG